MSLDNIISVSISQTPIGITANGFGTPLLLSALMEGPARVKSYTAMSEVEADFPDSYCAERLAAAAMFNQSPRPPTIKFGRITKPTMRYKISALTPTSFHATEYVLHVKGEEFDEEVSFTSDADATDAEFAEDLVAALNAVTDKNFTASGASSPVTVTANAAGDFFSIEVKNRALMSLVIDHADPGIAADLLAIATEDSDFFSVIPTQFSAAMITAAATWCNTNKRLFLFDTAETKAVSTALGAGEDVGDTVNTSGLRFVSGHFHPSPAAFLSAALNARCLPLKAGSETWFGKQLEGVAPVKLTPTERTNLVNKNLNSYEDIQGVRISFNGRTSNGSYIDLQRGVLWLASVIQTDVFNLIAQASATGKVGYDRAGRELLITTLRASMKKGVDRGFVADGEYSFTVPEVADVSSTNRGNRFYPDIAINFRAVGAIQSAAASITMSV